MSKLTLSQLESHLWESANILRGSIDSADYKNYIFGLLFLKRLNDVFEESQVHIAPTTGEEARQAEHDTHQFVVPASSRWQRIQSVTEGIGEAINEALAALEQENATLSGVLATIDYNDSERLPDRLLQQLIKHFSAISLGNASLTEPDMLGRAYEYLIRQFADDAGKKGGEFYTPSKVVELIVKLIKPEEGMRVCDPTAGSGGMLIQTADYIRAKGGNPRRIALHGQERNLKTWAIGKMNLLLHGLCDHRIEKGDTIREPKLLADGELILYDRVIANPPFSLSNWGQEEAKADKLSRFRFGIPPKDKGDLAFVQHMVATLNPNGKAGVVVPNGVLFRSGAEAAIRKGLLAEDLVEAVIALPPNLFYGTGIPACILLLNKNKEAAKRQHVFFLNATGGYHEGKNQNFLRDSDVESIVSAYERGVDIEKYCRLVHDSEIQANDYNLNLARYIDSSEQEAQIDVGAALVKLRRLEEERSEIEGRMLGFLKELGYDA
ncbi:MULTISPECIES: type I restriction-modification system subunit M [Brevibacillus]|uniref:site-specific DNA-methyltransferase (adenine-specific) n=1 Tax=Brevibacillus parabrevis TaxID=54914 RepID=A0A4Y3PPA0_BREPA|nr:MULTISPECIES: class I SAM-dependent DNA methyltransferase [Brevibacillus]MDR4999019.1 class I SAM-dependent DNA methyltransferase [Brevibacillus parabrevis]RNB93921.1 SAM-dependent DNA methyltransferase [Brevibacillus parabrevis]UED67364.1 type I restriction-modification system subunit M [Brevibacillus sp. HD3.3A]WDV93624.1 class I SAM-dependent DNA methyltransferase [Brevibacillus parabrevis]GEB34715.1 type I restriction-modification system subunit M [Brevibacillus parabrevis]